MSPICPRCGGELKEVVIFAWKHLYADMEENCGGKDVAWPKEHAELPAEPRHIHANPARAVGNASLPTAPAPGVLYQCRQCGAFKAPWQGALCKPCWSLEEEKVEERERTLRGYERS